VASLVGSLKLQVSFAKEPYKKDDILEKRPMVLRSLLIVASPPQASSEVSAIVNHVTWSRYRVHSILLVYTFVFQIYRDAAGNSLNRCEAPILPGEVGGWGRVPLERWGAGVEYH